MNGKMHRILVTGSRDWPHDAAFAVLRPALARATAERPDGTEPVVVHGACPTGADHWADNWAHDCLIRTEPHPADWEQYGKPAGFRRNAEMVALGADVCLAFLMPCAKPTCRQPHPHDSHGTSHCADCAEGAGIPVRRYRLTEDDIRDF